MFIGESNAGNQNKRKQLFILYFDVYIFNYRVTQIHNVTFSRIEMTNICMLNNQIYSTLAHNS